MAIAFFLFTVPQVRAQAPSADGVFQEAGALQGKLAQWRQTLSSVNFSSLNATQTVRNLLEQERASCLAWIDTLNRDIAAVQSRPTPAAEVQLVLDAERFGGATSALGDSLNGLASLPQGSGNMSALSRWLPVESKIRSMGSYFDEARLMRQLDAIGAKPAAPKRPGEISGRVYRADNGKPLAGATVMLRVIASFGPPLRAVETGPDGAFSFTSIPPGQYQVGAYLKRSAHGPHGPTNGFGPGWAGVNLGSAQELSGIDIKVHPLASVTQMDERTLATTFGGERVWLGFGPGFFSPDGNLFGFVVTSQTKQVWVYDLKTKLLTPVITRPPLGFDVVTIAWVGAKLYAEYARGPGSGQYFAWTPEGRTQISAPSKAVLAAIDRSRARQSGTVNAGRFTISAVSPTCYHCSGLNLTARPAGGGKSFVIAGGSWELGSFAVEDQGSLVLFPRFTYAAIALFDLNTRQAREAYLPIRAQQLLDARLESGGYLVAYASYGPCEGYGDQAGSYEPQQAPRNVCFATIPWAAQK